ncbi:UvrD-helicase domain-containing protein [Bacillus paralicheniformis]|uniref:UvrD-helicase domain-containing protein n=1 Tax=Bacillus paralicheniformis TaxID=1648923 RepID=UPI0035F57B29
MRIINCKDWTPLNGMVLQEEALNAIKQKGNISVVAGPGAGKTELLAQKAGYLFETEECKPPHKILAISFKVDAARNLGERVKKRYGQAYFSRFESRTFDSFSKSLLDQFILALPEKYRPKIDYDIINKESELNELVKSYITESNPYFPNWQNEYTPSVFYKKMIEDKLPHHLIENDLYSWLVVKSWSVLIKGKQNLKSSLTFPMITMLADYLLRENPLILKAIRATYTHVFLDEFQDTTYHQYSLLKTIFMDTNVSVTAVGDHKQRIMGWAGALKDAFKTFNEDFKSQEIRLLTNFRSAPKLVQIQNILSQNISPNHVDVEVSKQWGNLEGLCEIWNYNDHIEEAFSVAAIIKDWMNKDQLRPRDFCIIVKQYEHIYSKELIKALESLGIHARLEKEYQEVLSEECVNLILNILRLSIPGNKPVVWLETIETISLIRGRGSNTENNDLNKIEKSLYEFIQTFRNSIFNCKTHGNKEEIKGLLEDIISFIDINKLKSCYPKYRKNRLLGKITNKFVNIISLSLEKYKDWDLTIRDILGDFSIPIMTIHKSKGLEYNTVIFLGLEDGAFWSFSKQPESDKKAFFVALSRAKERVIFTFSQEREILSFGKLKQLTQNQKKISELYKLLINSGVPVVKK